MSQQQDRPSNEPVEPVETMHAEAEADAGVTEPASEVTYENAELPDLKTLLEAAEAKVAQHRDEALRSRAELENVRRRAERDVENAHKYGLEKFIQRLLPVLDSLELGLAAAEGEGEQLQKVREGMTLTLKMFSGELEKAGITTLEPHGEAFNPEFHQAMTMVPSPEHPANTVIECMQKGYLLNERLVRPAMVVVSSGGSD